MLTYATERDYTGAEAPEQSRSDVPDEFRVAIDGFDGPFDLLITLIQQRELDITEVSLSLVTDEFISYIEGFHDSTDAGLNRASEFLEVAATLLDLKIARLLPQGEVTDAEDVAALEARDLLFARLLQYRAYSQVSQWFAERMHAESQRITRVISAADPVRADPPPLLWTLSLQDFVKLAENVFSQNDSIDEPARVEIAHIHAAPVSLRGEASEVVSMLQQYGTLGFHEIIAHAASRSVIVARFLTILELYRCDAVTLQQHEPLTEITVAWVATQWDATQLTVFGGTDEW